MKGNEILCKFRCLHLGIALVCVIFAISTPALTRSEYKSLQKKKNSYAFESHKEYDFEACRQYEEQDSDDKYFIRCNGQEPEYLSNFSELKRDSKAIEAKIYQESLLKDLKSYTSSQLETNYQQLSQMKDCLSKKEKETSNCQEVRKHILETIREELPKLRATMSMMNTPSHLRRGGSSKLYSSKIQHEVPAENIPSLTKDERKKIGEETRAIEHFYQQSWFNENSSNKCIEMVSPSHFKFKEDMGNYCKGYLLKNQKKYTDEQFDNYRKQLKENYFKTLSRNPLLAKLSITGAEEDEVILSSALSAVDEMAKSTKHSLTEVSRLEGNNIAKLLRKNNVVNSYIKSRGGSKVLCDVSQSFKDDEDFKELKDDLLLAGGAIIGGGLCAFTAGLGCVIGVAIVAETTGLTIAQTRYQDETHSFNAGLSSAKDLKDRKTDRDLSLLLAPLAVAGEVVGTTVKVGSKVLRSGMKSDVIDHDLIGVKERADFRNLTTRIENIEEYSMSSFITRYENFVLASPRLNGRWIDKATDSNAAFFLDIENAALKRLNDSLGDKGFVTSLTNLHKEMSAVEINKILSKYPDVDIEVYSDFKSLRYAFSPKDLKPVVKENLLKDLQQGMKQVNEEFAKKVSQLDGVPANENPGNWFLAGVGDSADQAGQSAKMARQLERKSDITTFDEVKSLLQSDINNITDYSKKMTDSHPLHLAGLTEVLSETGKRIPSLNVFEVARKIKAPTQEAISSLRSYSTQTGSPITSREAAEILRGRDLAEELNLKYGSKLSFNDGRELMRYTIQLDSLTPGLWVKQRVNANLNDAHLGGLSGDVTGMGARNIRQVAEDIANSKNADVSQIIDETRKGERKVTQTFDDIKNNFTDTITNVLKRRGIEFDSPCSGDDCVVIPKVELDHDTKNDIIKNFSSQTTPSQYRLSFIPKGVSRLERTNLAVHGELVEKELRKKLLGVGKDKIPADIMSQITIATDMPKQINSGDISLIIGVNKNAKLSDEQRKLINSYFNSSVKKVNQNLAQELPDQEFKYGIGQINWVD